MEFPQESIELAENLTRHYRKEVGDNKQYLARKIYKGYKFAYGYLEAMLSNLWLRYPHELKSSIECLEAGIYIYCVAKAAGLNPRAFLIDGLGDFGGNTGHLAVDVDVGNKHRVLIDPVQGLFGPVRYSKDSLKVRNNRLTSKVKQFYGKIEEITEKQLLHTIEYLRSNEGIISLLHAGQRLYPAPIHEEFILYNKKSNELEFQLRYIPPFAQNRFVTKVYEFDEQGNISGKRIDAGTYSISEWDVLKDKELLLSVSFDDEEELKDAKKLIRKAFGTSIDIEDKTALIILRELYYDLRFKKNNGFLFSETEREEIVKPHKERYKELSAKNKLKGKEREESFHLGKFIHNLTKLKIFAPEFYDSNLDRCCLNRQLDKIEKIISKDQASLLEQKWIPSFLDKEDGESVLPFAYYMYIESLLSAYSIACEEHLISLNIGRLRKNIRDCIVTGEAQTFKPERKSLRPVLEEIVIGQVQRYLKSGKVE